MRALTNIEKYYDFLTKNPDMACNKILTVYKKLVDDIKNPKEVTFYNEITEEEETHRYIFDEAKGTRPIRFIEQFCRHSKGKWAGEPVKLELFQKAFLEALFGFVDEETGEQKVKYRTILFGEDGKTYASGAYGIYNTVAKILQIYGVETLHDKGLKVEIAKGSSKEGKNRLFLKIAE